MSKHTPGPWDAEQTGDEWRIRCAPTADPVFPGKVSWTVAFPAAGRPDTDDTVEGNARLIAAAPDMLEALKYILGSGCCAGFGVEEAEAAIAKAEGKDVRP